MEKVSPMYSKEIQKMREYYEQLSVDKFDNLEEMGNFLETYSQNPLFLITRFLKSQLNGHFVFKTPALLSSCKCLSLHFVLICHSTFLLHYVYLLINPSTHPFVIYYIFVKLQSCNRSQRYRDKKAVPLERTGRETDK